MCWQEPAAGAVAAAPPAGLGLAAAGAGPAINKDVHMSAKMETKVHWSKNQGPARCKDSLHMY